MLKVYDLTIEQKTEPLGLDELQPRFSWKLESGHQNVFQTAYRLIVSNGEEMWDTGRVESGQSTLIEYLGAVFAPRTEYRWEVTVWDNCGESAAASSRFETGLLNGSAFQDHAAWITHPFPKEETASPVFIRSFHADKEVRRARLYATALGLYEAELNGETLGDGKGEVFFAPGWTNYHKRLQYQTYPLEVKEGANELRITLGRGWYCGALGFNPTPDNYGDRTALLAMLAIDYADGTSEVIGTDESWTVTTGAVRFSEVVSKAFALKRMPSLLL